MTVARALLADVLGTAAGYMACITPITDFLLPHVAVKQRVPSSFI